MSPPLVPLPPLPLHQEVPRTSTTTDSTRSTEASQNASSGPNAHAASSRLPKKEEADRLAIGGVRDAAQSVSLLQLVAKVERELGDKLLAIMRRGSEHHTHNGTSEMSWVNRTCAAIGSTDDAIRLPTDAIAAIRTAID